MRPGAIVVGAHANGLGVIRTLAARDVPTVAITTRPFDIAHYSRWVSEHHRLPRLHEEAGALVDLLERHASRWSGWAVFPTNDDALTALAGNHERLSRFYRLAVQPWEVVSHLVDKDRMHALAAAAGLDVPVCHGPATVDLASRPGVRFPLVVKPVQHDRLINAEGVKLFLVQDGDELRAAVDRLARLDLAGLAFEFIPGGDGDIFVHAVYMHRGGDPSPGVTIRKVRQNPSLTGSARVAEVVGEIPELREATIAVARRAGLHGLAFAEFKRDSRTGRFRFVEVNARPVLFNGVLPPTGIDLVATAWADIVLGTRPALRREDWRGVWIHEQADVLCSWTHRREEALSVGEFLAPYRRPRTFAVWSARDPRPFLAQTALTARRAWRAVSAGRPWGGLSGA